MKRRPANLGSSTARCQAKVVLVRRGRSDQRGLHCGLRTAAPHAQTLQIRTNVAISAAK